MGLKCLAELRNILSDIMLKNIHRRILLYGYGYTGRFLRWYADYYHGIKPDYIIAENIPFSMGYEQEIFTSSLFEFNYKDVKDCIVWVGVPMTESIRALLDENGYVKDETYFDFFGAVYGEDVCSEEVLTDVFHKKKSGNRDIQFLEWLEWKYDCNFVAAVERKYLTTAGNSGHAYKVTTQKELFQILDICHCNPKSEDKIFDFGCGKGGAIVSFLDYGFEFAGGVEYEPGIYDVLKNNIYNLGLEECTECLEGDGATIKQELDKYSWFYFFAPFTPKVFEKCLENITDSIKRCPRHVRIIYINADVGRVVEENESFRITKEFTVPMRNRVVNMYENVRFTEA